MKKFKNIVSILLSFVMIFVFAVSCSKGNSSPDSTSTPTGNLVPTPTPTASVPSKEYTLEKEPGHNQLTFYWNYKGDYSNCDIWLWWDGKEGSGNLFHECEYGAKVVVNVPESVSQVGFIVRRDCSEPGGSVWGSATKDFEEDRFAVIEGEETFIYLKSGVGSQYTSKDGGKTLEIIKKFTLAGITDFDKIQYNLTPATKLTSMDQIKVYQGSQKIDIAAVSSLNRDAVSGIVTLKEDLDISKPYEIEIEGFGRKTVVPTSVFDTREFIDNYTYDGDDLGSVIKGDSTTFKVWAPTASKVVLDLYEEGHIGEAYKNIEMTRTEKGVWEHTEKCGHGTYYTYTVTTSVGTQTATDPYAKSAGANGDRSMVIDLSTTNPENWDKPYTAGTDTYTEAVIWEVHVRDFSNKIAESQYKGKYLAFTEKGLKNSAGVSVGIDYLVNLGVTHVHLLPVYDYATVDETNPDGQFNWGYDPKNYNVPEGSYSTDPYKGEVRVNEYKKMVQALHNEGIAVVMDVVYNHTYDANSSFNRIVPYYYYRYTPTGANSSASGCGNDTASERKMFRKFMVDSVSYWASEYKLDGFRFDLMGLHDLETMQQIETAVHNINPKALIYGEGWTMGSTIDGSAQANQTNINRIDHVEGAAGGIAVFNDVIRDGLKGSVFDKTSKGYISGEYAQYASKVQFGMTGGKNAVAGWYVKNAAVINYMSAHDNHTLWDKLALSNAANTVEERLAMNRIGAAILMLSQGTPFMQAGEEMLRTKNGDENSYKSSDEINNINWEALTPDSDAYKMMNYYKGLIELRKSRFVLTTQGQTSVTFDKLQQGGMTALFNSHKGESVFALINPTAYADSCSLDGEWKMLSDGTNAGSTVLENVSGSINIPPYSVIILSK